MINTFYDMKSPNGHLFDDTILTEGTTCYLRDGDVVDMEEHDPFVCDDDDRFVAEALAVDCTTEPVRDEKWWKI